MGFSFIKKTSGEDLDQNNAAFRGGKNGPGLAVFWLDEKWVKVVFAKGKIGRCEIESLAAISVEGKEDETLIKELRLLVSDQRMGVLPVFVDHPAHLSRSRLLRLPSHEPKELEVMVELQVEKHTPDTKEDTLTYHKILHSDTEGYSQVFLVMTHQDRVSRSVRIAQRAFTGLQGVTSDVDGLAQWMNKQKKPEYGGTLLIDLDHKYATLLVLHEGEVCFHRSIAARREAIVADPKGAEAQQFFGELHRSIMAYDEEGMKGACARIYLIGDPAAWEGLVEQMKKEMHLSVTALPPQMGFDFSSRALERMDHFSGMSFAGLLGLLNPGKPGDLTPVAVKIRRLFHRKVMTVSILAGQILFGILLVFSFLFYGVHQDMKYALYLESTNNQIAAPARELQVSIKHLKIVQGRVEKRGILLEAMAIIAQATSPAIRWTGLTYDQNSGIVIKGVSTAMANVFEMVSALEKSKFFSKPEARRVTRRKVDGQDITDFEIILPLAGMAGGADEAA